MELLDFTSEAERLRRFLNLPPAPPDPVFCLQRPDQPKLYLFDHLEERKGPTGVVHTPVSVCLLAAKTKFADLSLKAHRKRHAVLESLEASATGSEKFEILEDPEFNERITLYARDAAKAGELLTLEVRAVLSRALLERQAAPTFVLSERYALLTCRGQPGRETPLEALELLAGDLLSLYALIS